MGQIDPNGKELSRTLYQAEAALRKLGEPPLKEVDDDLHTAALDRWNDAPPESTEEKQADVLIKQSGKLTYHLGQARKILRNWPELVGRALRNTRIE